MKYARLFILFLPLWLLVMAAPALAGDITLHVGGQTVHAEVADTLAVQERGLMGRGKLCANCGMLFVFAKPGHYGFWMKNTPLPLSIAFIGGNGRIINIAEMQPNTLKIHYPRRDALFTLEMRRGWFAAHGIKPGDRVTGLPPRATAAGSGRK